MQVAHIARLAGDLKAGRNVKAVRNHQGNPLRSQVYHNGLFFEKRVYVFFIDHNPEVQKI